MGPDASTCSPDCPLPEIPPEPPQPTPRTPTQSAPATAAVRRTRETPARRSPDRVVRRIILRTLFEEYTRRGHTTRRRRVAHLRALTHGSEEAWMRGDDLRRAGTASGASNPGRAPDTRSVAKPEYHSNNATQEPGRAARATCAGGARGAARAGRGGRTCQGRRRPGRSCSELRPLLLPKPRRAFDRGLAGRDRALHRAAGGRGTAARRRR